MNRNQKLAATLVIVIPLTLAVIGWQAFQKPVANAGQAEVLTPELPTVEVLQIEFVPTPQVPRTYLGSIRAGRTSELGFNRTGRLVGVKAGQGARITAGDVLAEIDSAALRAQLQELQAQKSGADSMLAELLAGPRPQTVAAARTEVADLEAQQALAKIDFDRRERLRNSGSIAAQEFDEARLVLSSVEQRLEGSRQRLAELEEGTRSERIAMQRAELARLLAAIERTQVDIDESQLVAPYDAVVSQRLFDEGSIVPAGSPMFRLVEQRAREAWIGLPADLAGTLEPESIYWLEVEQSRFPAKLQALLPELDTVTRTQTAIFQCIPASEATSQDTVESHQVLIPGSENNEGSANIATSATRPWCDLAPGTLVRIHLHQPSAQSGFWIPTKSLTRGQRGLWSAFVVTSPTGADSSASGTKVAAEYQIERRDVEILQVDSDRVLVRGDLVDGDRLIATGSHRLVSGQRVNIAPRAEAK